MRIVDFVHSTNINESLIYGVVDLFESVIDFDLVASSDPSVDSVDGGFFGITYDERVLKFVSDNLAEIIDLADQNIEERAYARLWDFHDERSYIDVWDFIADFECLPEYSAGDVVTILTFRSIDEEPCSEDLIQIMNALAWFVIEEVCYEYMITDREYKTYFTIGDY